MSFVNCISLKNEALDVELECIPEFGGRLNRLVLNDGVESIQVLMPNKSKADLNAVTRYNNVILFPFPNRLDGGRWSYDGKSFNFPINEPEQTNALHGFLFNQPFEISTIINDENGIQLELNHEYDGSHDFYPYPFDIRILYSILYQNELTVSFHFTNMGDETAPFGFGWHPYFQLGDTNEMQLQIPESEEILVDDRQLPTGETKPEQKFQKLTTIGDHFMDTCFHCLGDDRKSIIHNPQKGLSLIVEQDENYEYVQIYTKPDRVTIAIEPVTSNINAFQTGEGLLELEAGQTMTANFSVSIERES